MSIRTRAGIFAGAMVSLLSGGRSLMAADALMHSARAAQPSGHRIDPKVNRKSARRINSRQPKRYRNGTPRQGHREMLRRRMGGFYTLRRMQASGWAWDDHQRKYVKGNA